MTDHGWKAWPRGARTQTQGWHSGPGSVHREKFHSKRVVSVGQAGRASTLLLGKRATAKRVGAGCITQPPELFPHLPSQLPPTTLPLLNSPLSVPSVCTSTATLWGQENGEWGGEQRREGQAWLSNTSCSTSPISVIKS